MCVVGNVQMCGYVLWSVWGVSVCMVECVSVHGSVNV